VQYRVSERGQIALPDEVRRRWNLADGGVVEIADLGAALVVVPAGRGGLRSVILESVEEAGGYSSLVSLVAADEPDLG
jgi:AbrB family looped-hinge helix DNA binding protein